LGKVISLSTRIGGWSVLEVQTMRLKQASFFFVLLLFSPFSVSAGQSIEFHDANVDSRTGEIRFDAFQSVDWHKLAQRDLKEFSLDHPTPAQVAKLKKHLQEHPDDETGTSSLVHFTSPVDAEVNHGFHYLLSSVNLQPLQSLRLDGFMGYSLNAQKNAIKPVVFSGQVVAKTPAPPSEDGAFVVLSDAAIVFTALSGSSFSARKVGKQDSYEYVRDGKKFTLSVQDEGLFDVMSASSFKLGQSEYIYVRWKPDTANNYGGCERQFSLFAVEQELKLVLNSRSDCDV
jgi:hypothetical protein